MDNSLSFFDLFQEKITILQIIYIYWAPCGPPGSLTPMHMGSNCMWAIEPKVSGSQTNFLKPSISMFRFFPTCRNNWLFFSPLDSYFNRERVTLDEIHEKYGHNGQVSFLNSFHISKFPWKISYFHEKFGHIYVAGVWGRVLLARHCEQRGAAEQEPGEWALLLPQTFVSFI